MDTIILEVPALTVLITVLAKETPGPVWAAMVGEFTNFTGPVLPFKLCNPGEAVLTAAVVMLGFGAATTVEPAGPKTVPLLKLVV